MDGSSQEILVRLRKKIVTIRPIAGTRKRGATPDEDAANAASLMADVKERAEHLMLLDLGRNDVGRVSKPGSVRVKSNYEVEYYSHVMHIASQVEGEIRDDLDAVDAMIAGFPAGTVSGAPKIRAMQIIDEMEPDRRGIYAGAVGYICCRRAGHLYRLRTAVVNDVVFRPVPIVYDSDPQSEFEETKQGREIQPLAKRFALSADPPAQKEPKPAHEHPDTALGSPVPRASSRPHVQ